ncbi:MULTISPECIES: hypothetical protein [unclassified Kribbella]|uniref:hypothetical protein n=1 Tax=unclassified Kribbella TaxID=2644121 RepID=UPI0033CD31FB
MTEQQGNNAGDDRPGPYQGVFGTPGGPPAPGPQPSYGAGQSPYAQQPGPPKQVTIASVISLGLGALCVLLGGLTLTSAGEQVAEVVAGSKDAKGLVVAVILVCAVAYILPAVYIRKRRAWARYMLIAVAATGIAGGLMALPNSILGLAIHATLLVLMLQQPTKLWFHHR